MSHYQADSGSPVATPPAANEQVALGGERVRLTVREAEVLGYLAFGWETDRIAEKMGVQSNTVRNHVTNLRAKLGASSRLEAVVVARRLGLLAE